MKLLFVGYVGINEPHILAWMAGRQSVDGGENVIAQNGRLSDAEQPLAEWMALYEFLLRLAPRGLACFNQGIPSIWRITSSKHLFEDCIRIRLAA